MSKGSRNRQQARERIAQARALEARRRRRRRWLAGTGAVVVAGAAAVGITLGVSGAGGGSHAAATGAPPQLRLASLSRLGPMRPAPPPGPVGSESVPVPAAPALAGNAASARGQVVDGISCQTGEQTIFHIHIHLTVFVNGAARQVPAAVGIPGAQAVTTSRGPFIASGKCFYWLHTHAPDGIVHVESPVHRTYTLGNFFDEWGQPLGTSRVGPASGQVTAIYNGRLYLGNPRNIPLDAHAQIQLEVGTPLVAPESITWPSGL